MSSVLTQARTSSVLSKHDRGPERLRGLPLVLSSIFSHTGTLSAPNSGLLRTSEEFHRPRGPGVIHTASESY